VYWDDGHPNPGRRHAAIGEVGLDAQQSAYAHGQHSQQEHEHWLEEGRAVFRAALVRLRPVSQQCRLAVHLWHGRLAARVLQGHEPLHAVREVRQRLRVNQKMGAGVARRG